MLEEPVFTHEYFMKEALKEADKAAQRDEVPVGAVVVANNIIIARSHNLMEALGDVTAHAEMQAITAATNTIGSKYLNDCSLYVSLEPCLMCAGAIFWAQLGALIYGASDSKRGFSLVRDRVVHPKTQIIHGIMELECEILLKEFFEKKRS